MLSSPRPRRKRRRHEDRPPLTGGLHDQSGEAGGAPQILLGSIGAPVFDPFEVSGLLFAFDGGGGVTQVGAWSARLAPAAIPEPGTLALAGIAAASASRPRPCR